MRFGVGRMITALTSMFGAKTIQGYTPNERIDVTTPKKTRNKTGGPNWLKIAINSQKHR